MRVALRVLVVMTGVVLSGCPKKPQTLPDASNPEQTSGGTSAPAEDSSVSGGAMSAEQRAREEAIRAGTIVYFDYDRAEIKPRISFHGLRHTWASLAIEKGLPLLVVAKNLGHADGRMVEKHYGHLTESYVAKAVREHAPRFGMVKPSNVVPMREVR